jgi:uncharacterized protein (TIGR00266 family)
MVTTRQYSFGELSKVLEFTLGPGETLTTEPGLMIFKDSFVSMDTESGGLMGGFKRKMAGESFFTNVFTNRDPHAPGRVAISVPRHSTILPLDLSTANGTILCRKGMFYAGVNDVKLGIGVTKKLSTIAGERDFVLQKIEGSGTAYLTAHGKIMTMQIPASSQLSVDPDWFVGVGPARSYDTESVGSLGNALFSGEGKWVLKITGPAILFMQDPAVEQLSAVPLYARSGIVQIR